MTPYIHALEGCGFTALVINAMKKLIPTHTTAAHTTNPYLGYSRQECRQLLANSNIESIAFGHWLAIPSQQLLLVFKHQRCVATDDYSKVA
ncbi:hypothetical protein [Psychrobacter sp. TB20-MNA-CIBAN-0197]|uniref:hypothetical protein n=3 Tax=Moraxellaceae TaxID=468 RepID=UPI00040ED0FD